MSKRKRENDNFFGYLKRRGLTYPGYRYLGPFNSLDNGEPVNHNDAVAKEHDEGYAMLQKQGINPYTTFNDADVTALKKWKANSGAGIIAKSVFHAKDWLSRAKIIKRDLTKLPSVKRAIDFGHLGKPKKFSPNLRTIKEENPSLKNLQSSTDTANMSKMSNAAAGSGSGNNGTLTETPVDDVDVWNVQRGPADYCFASLPFLSDRYVQQEAIYRRDHIFRMTSPYNTEQTTGTADGNSNSGTQLVISDFPADGAVGTDKADWYDYYAGMYNYYHVVACRYNVTVVNHGEPIWAYLMFTNDERPPEGASNRDIQAWKGVQQVYLQSSWNAIDGTNGLEVSGGLTDVEMNETVNANTDNVNRIGAGYVTSRGGKVMHTFKGVYHPGDYTRDIRLDTDVENWTGVATNPTLPERMYVMIKPLNDWTVTTATGSQGDDLKYHIRVHLDYLVEFKELKTALKYPVQRQPLTVTIQSSTTTAL